MTLFEGESLSVYRFVCTRGPSDRPFAEMHARHSLSYVRRGSFGCRTLGAEHEMVPGAVMVGAPGREYTATHEHHGCGDECLSIKLAPDVADGFGIWSVARIPPLPQLMVLGERLNAATSHEEAAMHFAAKAAELTSGRRGNRPASARERRRAVEAALWLEANAAEPVGLEDAARQARLSPFHFLRVFREVTGATPHQYLLRIRLARAARLLSRDMPVTQVALECGFGDLSNFVRTFRRAAGATPGEFRKIFQVAARATA